MEAKKEDEASEIDITYLTALDSRLRKVVPVNASHSFWRHVETSNYSKEKMSKEEIDKVLHIVENRDLPFMPINTNMNFSVGFTILKTIDIVPKPHVNGVYLQFIENQLPDGYDFNVLSKVFLSPRNLRLMDFYKLPPIKERSQYTY